MKAKKLLATTAATAMLVLASVLTAGPAQAASYHHFVSGSTKHECTANLTFATASTIASGRQIIAQSQCARENSGWIGFLVVVR